MLKSFNSNKEELYPRIRLPMDNKPERVFTHTSLFSKLLQLLGDCRNSAWPRPKITNYL